MIKNLLYIVFASFIFFMGYISEDFIELYETRPNQYPPYGKEVVDVNGTKFMRDIKDETNENEEKPSEDFIALEKNTHQDAIRLRHYLKNILVQIYLITLILFGKVAATYAKRKKLPLLLKSQSFLNLWFFRIQHQQRYLKIASLSQL